MKHTKEKIIQITEAEGNLYGLDAEGNVYRLFTTLLEASQVTNYQWIKIIDKNKIRK